MSSITTTMKRWVAGLVIASMTLASNAQTITYFHNDVAGSPLVATDATGNVVWKENYKPYGDKLNNQPASSDNKIGYAGKPFDNNTGLTYMGARYYDPVVGRFMGVDPVDLIEHDVHSFNRYAYANNNPNKYVDPNGGHPALVVLGVNMGVGALIGAGAAGVTNALIQYHESGTVQWGGVGGVLDAAGSGALVGALFGAIGGGEAGSAAGALSAARVEGIVAKDGTAITGLTRHGVDRVIGDGAKRAGTKPDAILDAIKNPAKIKEGVDSQNRPFKVYTGENARVVINPETGKIVSTNPLSRDGAHQP